MNSMFYIFSNLTNNKWFVIIHIEVIYMFFDTHIHINSEQLYQDHFYFMQRAISEGVEYMVVVGYDLESSKLAVELTAQYDNLYAAIGFGPNDCNGINDEMKKSFESLLNHEKVVAVGEIGLDYYYDYVEKQEQKEMFEYQIELAIKHDLPIIIHCRDAYLDTFNILKKYNHKGIMHCYSGSVEMAENFIGLGYYISLAGPVTFKNAKVAKQVAKEIGLEHLVIETDCPYLSPEPYRGRLNEPANVVYIAKEIAKLKKIDINEVAKQTTFNAKTIFGIK